MATYKKIGRNERCPCGSGRKYKHCHGSLISPPPLPFDPKVMMERHKAEEYIRTQQQGRGRPIVAAKLKDHQIVAVGNRVFWSDKWRTFIDFLEDYFKQLIGSEWGNGEIAKPLRERHPILQWYEAKGRQQQAISKNDGTVKSMTITGAAAAYYSLAYGLYLLAHNVELQDRLLTRLRDPRNFQGAYYEVLIASVLIRAGFELVLEDEDDRGSKHCEFAAVSKTTGKRYWIEAKMKAVDGLLGKTSLDGSSDPNPTSHIIRHITGALSKPADADRLIFIDVNTDMPADFSDKNVPAFFQSAERRLIRFEASPECGGCQAYVFLTNLAFHRDLEGHPSMMVLPFGLNLPDFNRPGIMSVSERYRQELKHAEGLAIAAAFIDLLKLPATFDGELPAEVFEGALPPVKIGESYFFEGVGGGDGTTGTVTSAVVVEGEKAAYVGITSSEGVSMILKQPMTDAELADWRAHGDAYFGEVRPVPKGLKTPLDMFKFLMTSYATTPREKLIEWLSPHVETERLAAMTDDDLRMMYCEGMTAATMKKASEGRPPPAAHPCDPRPDE